MVAAEERERLANFVLHEIFYPLLLREDSRFQRAVCCISLGGIHLAKWTMCHTLHSYIKSCSWTYYFYFM